MGKGIATVEHFVSTHDKYCEYCDPSDGFGERSVCRYCAVRSKTGKRGTPIQYLPKCTLFGEWLEREGISTVRCTACIVACGEVSE